jgi:hypothetical protein
MDTALAAWLLVAISAVGMTALAVFDWRKEDSSSEDR